MTLKPTLIYVYDPLCGWCYGFHPVMKKLAERFKNQLNFRVVPGGLAVGEAAQPIKKGYGYIKDNLRQVEDKTGVEFGQNFKLLAEEGSYLYDSEPGCLAQTTINRLAPERAIDFSGRLQKALFIDGLNLNDPDTFLSLIDDYPVEPNEFETLYTSDEIKRRTHQQFEWCREQDALAFPSLLLEMGKETGLMSRGYRPFDTLESHLHHLLRNIEKLS